MTQAGFYELITGHFADGREIDSVPEKTHLALSISDHISRLLNSRQGALSAAPTYGLPDNNLIYANQAASREQLRAAIAQAILRHEPRVISVDVRSRLAASKDFVHGYHITCQLRRGGNLDLDGWVRPDGRLHLQSQGADANTAGTDDD